MIGTQGVRTSMDELRMHLWHAPNAITTVKTDQLLSCSLARAEPCRLQSYRVASNSITKDFFKMSWACRWLVGWRVAGLPVPRMTLEPRA